jgi:hypothetical protein
MVKIENTEQITMADTVLDLLRQLSPRDRLKVLAQALPEIEQELVVPPSSLETLRGLWKDLDSDIHRILSQVAQDELL